MIYKLLQLVADKRIVLVGGAESHVERLEAIKCDLIFSIHHHATKVGLYPNIVFNGWENINKPADAYILNIANPKYHLYASDLANRGIPVIFTYDTRIYRGKNPHGPFFEWANAFSKELATQPFSGMLALKLLQSLPVREIFMTGFTFYADEQGRFPFMRPPHHVEPQIEWLKNIARTDARIRFDKKLSELVPLEDKKPVRAAVRKDDTGTLWRV